MSRAERFAAWLYDRRWLLAAVCALITALALWQAAKVGVDNSLRIWFLDDDPHLVAYRSYQERFGNDEVVLVVFANPAGMAEGRGLQLLQRAETMLASVDGVAGAMSIAALADLPHIAETGRLISADGRTAAIVLRLHPGDDSRREVVLGNIERTLDKLGEPHHLAGIGVLFVALNRLTFVDASALFLGALAMMMVVLRLVYGRLALAFATLGVATLAMLWTMGLYGAAGRSLNMVTGAMPTLIVLVGVAEMVHLLLFATSISASGPRERSIAAVSHMLRPCILNIVTSVAGFAALAAAPLPAVRDLGIFAAAGLAGCLVLTLLGATWVIAAGFCESHPRPWLQRGAVRLAEFGIRRPVLALSICGAAAFSAIVFASSVVVDTFTLEHLSREHRVRRDSDFIEAKLAPYVPIDFLVRSPRGEVRPELIGAIERWQRAGERLPGVGWSRSPADTIGAAEKLDPRRAADGTLRVTFSMRMQSARDVDHTMQALVGAAKLPQGTTVQAAGYLPLYVRMVDYIVDSQIIGFGLAFIAVFGVIALAFRSLRIAALAVPSNLLPLLFILGAMGLAGIRLDVATVTIAAVVLGLVVDDTVHFLHRLNDALAHCADRAAALRETVASAGHAILVTALVMTLGFAVFALAEIRSLVYFGLMIALAMATSVITDLLVVPALVMLRERRG